MKEFAPIYRGLSRVGIPPRAADDLELWEVGAVLGMHEDQPEDTFQSERMRRIEEQARRLQERETAAR